MKRGYLFTVIALLLSIFPLRIKAEYSFEIGGELNLGAGNGYFAPYYLHANNHGKITQSKNAQLDIWAVDSLDLSKKFDFSWGVEVLGGYANKADYRRWNPATKEWFNNPQGPAPIWIQQLYGEVKWRCLFLRLGLKDIDSHFVNQELSSGDLIWSGNSRGIPEARIGFVDWQDIPWINHWVQADICLSYGKFIDTDWVNNHFDYYRGRRNPGTFWTYKRLALRSNPTKPFMFQIGIQMTGLFGGHTYYYAGGEMTKDVNNYNGFKDFFQILLPFWTDEKEGYRVGDTKGCWDIAARYRFKGGENLRAYVQFPFEDSSGIYKHNGFDGLWGLEFNMGRKWWINSVVAEYLDLTHMSGPILYDPVHQTNPLDGKASGMDAYYNNYYYRCYVNYGLNMGTPMVQGLLFYSSDGVEYRFEDGTLPYFRVRGFHLAVSGNLAPGLDYVVKYNHRKAWGMTNSAALIHPVEADSFVAGATYSLEKVPGLSMSAYIGVDHGNMPANAVGAMVSVGYQIPIIIK